MSSYVSAGLRRAVVARADALCEYCPIHEDDTVFGCEVDHIISSCLNWKPQGGTAGAVRNPHGHVAGDFGCGAFVLPVVARPVALSLAGWLWYLDNSAVAWAASASLTAPDTLPCLS